MSNSSSLASGHIHAAPTAAPHPDLEANLSILREHGLDLNGFHLDPITLDIGAQSLQLKEPMFDLKQVRLADGSGAHFVFFPCKITYAGKPMFGFIWLDLDHPQPLGKVRVLGPRLKVVEVGGDITLEFDPRRASLVQG